MGFNSGFKGLMTLIKSGWRHATGTAKTAECFSSKRNIHWCWRKRV